MSRRRDLADPAFGSDSFLDVVANLVGIVLIIIVLVGARVRELPAPSVAPAPIESPGATEPAPDDPELARLHRELAELQQRLMAALKAGESVHGTAEERSRTLANLLARQHELEAELNRMTARLAGTQTAAAEREREARELKSRLAALQEAVARLEKEPVNLNAIRYHQPVSQVVAGGEVFFECRNGRVTFIDLHSVLDKLRQQARSDGQALKTQWEVTGTLSPPGPFKLKYKLERVRETTVDPGISGLAPDPNAGFRYQLAYWELVPVDGERGEAVETALHRGSRLREVVDGLNPEQVVLTFWVYPENFGEFRTLRDRLYERGFTVAARPLPNGEPIAGSPSGTASRGQ